MSIKVLFDQGVPVPLKRDLREIKVSTVYALGWSTIENGELISAAEKKGFDVLLTTDRNLRYQQNLSDRRIAIAVLPTTNWSLIRNSVAEVRQQLLAISSGDFVEIKF